MRFMSFVTNLGRKAEWGFANVTNATTATVYAPRPYSYIAAIRGEEGKPLPKHLGGWKKRCGRLGTADALSRLFNLYCSTFKVPPGPPAFCSCPLQRDADFGHLKHWIGAVHNVVPVNVTKDAAKHLCNPYVPWLIVGV